MYRAVVLPEIGCDLHRFVWRRIRSEPLQYFRMIRVTFGVSSSSFAANMAVKCNSIDLTSKYPLAAQLISDSFYMDDGFHTRSNQSANSTIESVLRRWFLTTQMEC